MIRLLSFGMWNKLKNGLEFSKSNFENSCINDSILRLKGCINDIFSHIWCEEVSQIQKTGLK